MLKQKAVISAGQSLLKSILFGAVFTAAVVVVGYSVVHKNFAPVTGQLQALRGEAVVRDGFYDLKVVGFDKESGEKLFVDNYSDVKVTNAGYAVNVGLPNNVNDNVIVQVCRSRAPSLEKNGFSGNDLEGNCTSDNKDGIDVVECAKNAEISQGKGLAQRIIGVKEIRISVRCLDSTTEKLIAVEPANTIILGAEALPGSVGPQGPKGDAGTPGKDGVNGVDAVGTPGIAGPQGSVGDPATDDQMLSYLSGTQILSITGGNTINLSSLLDNTDVLASLSCVGGQVAQWSGLVWQCANATVDTDQQTLTVIGSGLAQQLQIAGGNTINIPDINTDSQTLSFNASTDSLTISGGNSVTLPYLQTEVDGVIGNEVFDITAGLGVLLSGTKATGYSIVAILGTDITSSEIVDGTINSVDIALGAVVDLNIAAGAVTSAKILDGTIVTADIANASITTALITNSAITPALIAACSSNGQVLKFYATDPDGAGLLTIGWNCDNDLDTTYMPGTGIGIIGTVISSVLGIDITSSEIVDGTVTGTDIAAATITAANIAAGTVTGANLAANTITNANIAASTITGLSIAANTISASNLAAGSVSGGTGGVITDGSIATVDMATGAVTSAIIADGTITFADIASNSCTTNQIMKYNGSAWACAVDVDTNTDAQTLSFTGGTNTLAISGGNSIVLPYLQAETDGVVGNEVFEITAGTGIGLTGTKATGYTVIASLGIDIISSEIVDGTIVSADIATSGVTSTNIADGTIVTADIANLAITNANLVNSSLTVNYGNGLSGGGSVALGGTITLSISAPTCTGTQKLSWNGTAFVCATDQDTTYTNGSGIGLVGTVFSNTGVLTTTAGTGLTNSGTAQNSTLNLTNTGVTAGTYNNVTVDAQGRATTGSNVAYLTTETDGVVGNEILDVSTGSGLVRSGTGTTSDPYKVGLITSCTANQLLKYVALAWVCANDTDTTYTQGTGITIAGDVISANALGTGVVTTTNILDGTILATDLATGAVTSTGILDGTVVTADLATGGVTSTNILDGTVVLADLAGNSVDSSKIVDASVTGTDIANATITGSNIAAATITPSLLAACSMNGQVLKYYVTDPDGAGPLVTGWNCDNDAGNTYTQGTGITIAANVISATLGADIISSEIVDGTIVGVDIASGTVTGSNIAAATITGANIAAATVANANLANSSLTVTSGNGLSGGGSVSLGGTTTLAINAPTCTGTQKLSWNGNIFVCSTDVDTTYSNGTGIGLTGTVFSNSGVLTATASTGVVNSGTAQNPIFGLTNTGVTAGTYNNVTVDAQGRTTSASNVAYLSTEVDGAVGNEVFDIVQGTGITVTGTKAAGYTVESTLGIDITGSEIVDGTIVAADIATGGVTSTNLLDGTVVLADLAGSSVDASKIIDSSVTGTDIAAGTITNTNLVNSSLTISSGNGLSGGGSVSLGGTTTLAISAPTCTGTQKLTWNGTVFLCAADADTTYTAGTGIGLAAGVFSNTGVLSATAGTGVTNSGTAQNPTFGITNTGVTAGTYNNVTIDAQGRTTSGSNIAYLTTETDGVIGNEVFDITAGTGITLSGTKAAGYTVTSVLGADIVSAEIVDGTIVSADISTGGVASINILNSTITFADLSQNGCVINEIPKWNGTAWACAADATIGGAGVNSFETIATTSGTNPVADAPVDTLTLTAGAGIAVTGDSLTDTITLVAVLGTDIVSSEIVDGTIVDADIASATITGAKIAGTTITGSNIAASTITNSNLVNSSLTVTAGTGLAGGGLVSLGGTVTLSSSLGVDITSVEIFDGTIATADIATGAITSGLILDSTIALADLSGNSVDSSKIVDGSVSNADLTSSTIGLNVGSTGTDVNVSGSPASLGGALTLNIPDASATARGLVTTSSQVLAGNKTLTGNTTLNSLTLVSQTISNLASGGSIGAASATVDIAAVFNINQTTADQTVTLPNPTSTTAGKVVYVNSVGTVGFTMLGQRLEAGQSREVIWNGSAWVWVGITNSDETKVVRKTADQNNATTTLANDTELVFSIGANEAWVVMYNLQALSPTAADIKFAVTAPAGATCKVSAYDPEGATAQSNIACATASGLIAGSGVEDPLWVSATIVNGATPGAVNLQWAEFALSGTNTVRAGSQLVAYKIRGADIAEFYYAQDSSIESGDIVALDGTGPSQVTKATRAHREQTVGVVSTQPGKVLGAVDGVGKPVIIGLAGRVPVKVKGTITPGDMITVSDIPSVGQRAISSGRVVGKALTGHVGNSIGEVTVLIDNGYWQAPVSFDLNSLISSYAAITPISDPLVTDQTAESLGLTDIAVEATSYNGLDQQAFDQILSGFTLQQGAIKDAQNKLAGITTKLDELALLVQHPVITNAVTTTNLPTVIDAPSINLAGSNVINQSIVFGKNVTLKDTLTVNGRVSGKALIVAGATKVHVDFIPPYETDPLIQATPNDLLTVSYRVTRTDKNGFDIELASALTTDSTFTWFAVAGAQD